MAALEFFFKRARQTQVGAIMLDASLEETHTKTNDVTSHPVEGSSPQVSDHIQRMPDSLRINGVVTNHPIWLLPSQRAPSPKVGDAGPVTDRVNVAYQELQRIMTDGVLISVVTSLRTYYNMALTELAITRDKSSGNVLNASMTLREVVMVSTERVDLPQPLNKSVAKKVNKGRQAVKKATPQDAVKSQSALDSMRSAAQSFFSARTGA